LGAHRQVSDSDSSELETNLGGVVFYAGNVV